MNLTKALQTVADSYFYEDLILTPLGDGEYDKARTTVYITDEIGWAELHGLEYPESDDLEVADLFHPSQFFDNASQIEHYLPNAVEWLMDGIPVSFAYVIVEDRTALYQDADGYDVLDEDHDPEPAGWTICALRHPKNPVN